MSGLPHRFRGVGLSLKVFHNQLLTQTTGKHKTPVFKWHLSMCQDEIKNKLQISFCQHPLADIPAHLHTWWEFPLNSLCWACAQGLTKIHQTAGKNNWSLQQSFNWHTEQHPKACCSICIFRRGNYGDTFGNSGEQSSLWESVEDVFKQDKVGHRPVQLPLTNLTLNGIPWQVIVS